jgi:hypothetical protein
MRRLLTLALTLALVSPLAAQPPAEPKKPAEPPKPAAGSLEDLVARALQHNAEIHAAQAKVRSAEAEYQKTKLEVLQKVAAAKFALDVAKKTARLAEAYDARQREIAPKGIVSAFELQKTQLDLERAAAEVQRLEAELNMMVGQVPGKPAPKLTHLEGGRYLESASLFLGRAANEFWLDLGNLNSLYFTQDGRFLNAPLLYDSAFRVWNPIVHTSPATPTSVSERIRLALDKQLKLDGSNDGLPLSDVLEFIREKSGIDVPVRNLVGNKNITVSLMAGELPIGAWLQAVEDSSPEIAIAVREYGILVTLRERLPRDAELMRDFWRRARTEATRPKEAPAPKKQ